MRKILGKITFFISWPIAKIFLTYFLNIKIIGHEKLKDIKPPIIVACNHVSFLDPFFVSMVFPWFSKVFPIRFAVVPRMYYKPYLFPFIWLYGSFPIQKGIGLENSLKKPIKYLERKQAVGIFPQGGIIKRGRPKKGRRGAAYLAIATGVPIIPMRVNGVINLGMKKFFSKKEKVIINIGDMFELPKSYSLDTIDEATKYIDTKIRELNI